jgi:hypothetical protein
MTVFCFRWVFASRRECACAVTVSSVPNSTPFLMKARLKFQEEWYSVWSHRRVWPQAGRPRFRFSAGANTFFFPTAFQTGSGALFFEVKRPEHETSIWCRGWRGWSYTSPPLYFFMTCFLIRQKDKLPLPQNVTKICISWRQLLQIVKYELTDTQTTQIMFLSGWFLFPYAYLHSLPEQQILIQTWSRSKVTSVLNSADV